VGTIVTKGLVIARQADDHDNWTSPRGAAPADSESAVGQESTI
jgi:hypothetical protein